MQVRPLLLSSGGFSIYFSVVAKQMRVRSLLRFRVTTLSRKYTLPHHAFPRTFFPTGRPLVSPIRTFPTTVRKIAPCLTPPFAIPSYFLSINTDPFHPRKHLCESKFFCITQSNLLQNIPTLRHSPPPSDGRMYNDSPNRDT